MGSRRVRGMDPELSNVPHYQKVDAEWLENHNKFKENAAAISRRDDWPMLAEQLRRVDWRIRFPTVEGTHKLFIQERRF